MPLSFRNAFANNIDSNNYGSSPTQWDRSENENTIPLKLLE